MSTPTSTYRLQFRGSVTFDRAVELVPHLKSLGVSHLYASPIFTATNGSTHGYDVVDVNEIDPAIGGRDGFDRLVAALEKAGLGLIIDIVPNHMAASLENAWWRDVLRHGRHSSYARHFDIDWSEKLTLPQLGKPIGEVLAAGELQLVHDPAKGLLTLAYFDKRLPLSDDSIHHVLNETGGDFEKLRALSMDAERMKQLLAEQHWQLLYWKDRAQHLNYRRFFEVAGLVGIRVEDDQVFEDTHRLTMELVRSGRVQGLRIDHIDGLADPKTYLERLRQAVGPDTFIVVEKILGKGETLPSTWPVSGTTGYEFISAMAELFVASDGLETISAAYEVIGEEHADFNAGLRAAKLLMIRRSFGGEVARLIRLVQSIYPALAYSDISSALDELLVAFPVYRTYGYRGLLTEQDEAVLDAAVEKARAKLPVTADLEIIGRLLRGEIEGDAAFEFRTRFQQLSGPIMAKAVEDTLFYRYNRLIATNEVGGEPGEAPGGVAAFHQMMADRRKHQPHGLSTTSTHDTKRGEDARTRLYALSERPEAWIEGVERWRELNKAFRSNFADGPAPEPNLEWMLYQALAGIWPEDFEQSPKAELRNRFLAYAEKAIREAKLRTDWGAENPDYENAVLNYAEALVSPDNQDFLKDFQQTLSSFVELGYLNSLSQTLIKLTAPGIADIYQGGEGLDLSLVDPDNRRPVDFGVFTTRQAGDGKELRAASLKRQIITSVLRHRNRYPQLFLGGDYLPLQVIGRRQENLVAFARTHKEQTTITIATRLMNKRATPCLAEAGSDFWEDTAVLIPSWLGRRMRDLLTGKSVDTGHVLASSILADHSVSFLVTDA
ncbi:malto-oligosyltrehalose synthase [Rhizobium mayense]|uniref:Malto-oligosyltrehalose synthase n=1 Tax=Rhizobium mayense TaxID=1312184 RepID=A0ABT7JT60_9HYPH|nr:malto-oligosyltrehalose synthase [Rhizobium mayense]MDL2398119.1 malto-oligosyltrehalose synthase [Rhizobium mayense]